MMSTNFEEARARLEKVAPDQRSAFVAGFLCGALDSIAPRVTDPVDAQIVAVARAIFDAAFTFHQVGR
ncbi:hypothetical protein [Catenuloplanes indicus]|uniref:Uncharacterized protein n=1 Tax=Catenuloplanes indicus TaxID=137267 RepID=A0AAE3VZH3_9ACTN|nr:hypothetical protein [Catenuloplanes indicus]MDQ0366044.1 hypothetical protein [Catenuloplanes indicus]